MRANDPAPGEDAPLRGSRAEGPRLIPTKTNRVDTGEIGPGPRDRGSESATHPGPLTGTVYLIGAGPGAADLITLRGLRRLRAADVIVYDRLIDASLLDEARADAERIYVGKGPRHHTLPQRAINALLVERARQGHTVARLKGGDPFVFGRGGEEALTLAAAGIPFEVIPGVTSAVAVPALAGIPVTHRVLASHFTVVTGHTCDETGPDSVNWELLAALGGSLVILMGVAALPAITARLLAAGLDPDTAAAVIQNGTMPEQRSVRARLAEIARAAAEAGIGSPAVTVIGATAGLASTLDSNTLSRYTCSTPIGG